MIRNLSENILVDLKVPMCVFRMEFHSSVDVLVQRHLQHGRAVFYDHLIQAVSLVREAKRVQDTSQLLIGSLQNYLVIIVT